MPKPQQPELRRSGFTVLDPDSIASDVEARERPGNSSGGGPVPEENRPGHHPADEQDKPSGDAFVAKARAVAADADTDQDDRGDDTSGAAADVHDAPPTQTGAPHAESAPVVDVTQPGTAPLVVRVVKGYVRVVTTLTVAPWRIGAGVVKGIRRQSL